MSVLRKYSAAGASSFFAAAASFPLCGGHGRPFSEI